MMPDRHTPTPSPPNAPLSTMTAARGARQDPGHPSWNNLLDKVEKRVRSHYATERMPAGTTLDDLVAETQGRVFRDLLRSELRDRKSFWGWVGTVADHALKDFGRRSRAIKRGRGKAIYSIDNPPSDAGVQGLAAPAMGGDLAAARAYYREALVALRECLAMMRPETAEVLRLRLLEDRSRTEICAQIGRNRPGTVGSIFSRGRVQLAAMMRTRGYEGLFEAE